MPILEGVSRITGKCEHPRERRDVRHGETVKKFRFDRAYYDRWYRDDETRTFMAEYTPVIVRFVLAYLDYLELEVRTVLDAGCGLGHWRTALGDLGRDVDYRGLETSGYLCRELGWEKGSIVDYQAHEPFDLVVCQGVLQYLSDAECKAAIHNLAELCGQALYLEVLTRRDARENTIPQRTDTDVYLRKGEWYRKRLHKHFVNLGGGLFLSRRCAATCYELWTP